MINLNELNDEQKQAVINTNGAVLVLAGAGSGKTKALTFRLAYLIEKKLAEPQNILAVTFTNKASKEMKARINNILGADVKFPFLGTFHAVCIRILRSEARKLGFEPSFAIYDQNDSLSIIKECFNKLNLSTKEINPSVVQNLISSAKNELVTPREYQGMAVGFIQQIVARIYPLYQSDLKRNNAFDFDDLIMETYMILKNNPDILSKYHSLFRYVLVDEYQDTNRAQYKLITMLASGHNNICVVGDEDQSIYAFRGSDITNILNFEKDYPEAKIIKLERNYRSTANILNAANEVIKQNTQRKPKKMWTEQGEGDLLTLYKASSEKDEAEFVSKKISELLHSNSMKLYDDTVTYSSEVTIAVLYRTNAQSRNIEDALLKEKIQYKLVGGTKFYERREVKDILSYIKVLVNPKDNISLFRIINTPKRKIALKAIKEIEELCIQYTCNYGEIVTGEITLSTGEYSLLSPAVKSLIILFTDLSDQSKILPPSKFIKYLLDKIKYLEYLDDGTQEGLSRIENVKELISLALDYDESTIDGLLNFVSDMSIDPSDDKNEKDIESSVTLMSVHGSKGLEFDYVFIIGFEEGLFPHARSLVDNSEMEEERRLAYVALTRARKKLYLIHAESRIYFGSKQVNDLSRFAFAIPEKLLEIKEYTLSFDDTNYQPFRKKTSNNIEAIDWDNWG